MCSKMWITCVAAEDAKKMDAGDGASGGKAREKIFPLPFLPGVPIFWAASSGWL